MILNCYSNSLAENTSVGDISSALFPFFNERNTPRPSIKLKIHRFGFSMWQMFQNYNCLNGKLGAGVLWYIAFYQNKPISFIAVVCTRMKAKYYRASRLVVLPDYQGIGVGKRFVSSWRTSS
jgi:GNAT superfamily N-acetyltransferase